MVHAPQALLLLDELLKNCELDKRKITESQQHTILITATKDVSLKWYNDRDSECEADKQLVVDWDDISSTSMTRNKGSLKLSPVSSDLSTAATCTLMKLQVLLHHLLLTSVRLLLKETVYVIVRELNLYLLNKVRIGSYVSDHVSMHVKLYW